jgi:cytochrome P450
VIGERQPAAEDMKKLEYLELVVKESMRLYPPAAQLAARIAERPDKVGGIEFDRGECIEVWPWLLHRSSQYWSNPEQFNPERFLNEPSNKWAYLPFSQGARACIGSKMAVWEIKTITVMVLREFDLALDARAEQFEPALVLTLRPENLYCTLNAKTK